MVPLSTVNGVRPGREGRGYKRRPDNNVTIWPPPLGPAGPWRRVKVNNGPSLRGSVGGEREEGKGVCRGGFGGPGRGQSPRVLMQAAVGRGLKCVYLWVCVLAGWLEGHRGHKVAALQSWHVVYVRKSVL